MQFLQDFQELISAIISAVVTIALFVIERKIFSRDKKEIETAGEKNPVSSKFFGKYPLVSIFILVSFGGILTNFVLNSTSNLFSFLDRRSKEEEFFCTLPTGREGRIHLEGVVANRGEEEDLKKSHSGLSFSYSRHPHTFIARSDSDQKIDAKRFRIVLTCS